MFSSIDHFSSIWDIETAATVSCLEKLTNESLSSNLVKEYRTIERLANHITDCVIGIPKAGGVPVAYEKKHYTDAGALLHAYQTAAAAVKKAVIHHWSDATLQEEVPMYGEVWKRGFVLWVTVLHQVHHRGQLTTLMRLAGLKVPGVYGPAKEEWEAMNFPPAD